MTNQSKAPEPPLEKLLTIKKAAQSLGVEYRQLLIGVSSGEVPSYRVHKSRRMVLCSEILASMRSTLANGDSRD